ncbi:UNVERIFIED_CONTAM: hypothetical protein K2H54_012128 [Gekko kuhli]
MAAVAGTDGAPPAASSVAAPAEDPEPSAPPASAAAPSSAARPARLPLSRVKALVKADPDVTLASQEAVFILARATELFVETIAKDAYIYAQQGKRKTLQRKDLDNAIEAIDEFAFLEDQASKIFRQRTARGHLPPQRAVPGSMVPIRCFRGHP